ncbi:MAG: arginase family protein, partial [Planctomycetaceae bacterium]|nr:arginase family protein [Planctomycetaceae bacterium]
MATKTKPTSKASTRTAKASKSTNTNGTALSIASLEVTSEDNYFGIPKKIASFKNARYVIVQAGYEHTVSYGGGTAGGPRAIRTASQQVELYDDQLDAEIVPKAGVCTLDELNCDCDGEEINKRIYAVSKQVVAANKIPVLIGGEHTVSYGNVKACWEKHKDLWILHFD